MKSLLFIFFISFQSIGIAHTYYFGFAEIEYNDITQKFESTLIFTAHDLELAMNNEGIAINELSKISTDTSLFSQVEKYINKGFIINSGIESCKMSIVGFEVLLNGSVNFYLESTRIEIENEIAIYFDLLMDEYPEQQNKASFTHRSQTKTVPFLVGQKNQTIKLENT